MQALLKSATVIVITPPHRLAPEIAIAACRADAIGILDLGLGHGQAERQQALAALVRGADADTDTDATWGARWDHRDQDAMALAELAGLLPVSPPVPTPLPLLLLAGIRADQLAEALLQAQALARAVLLEVCDLADARAAQQAGYDGVILKGHEAGGRVGARSSFMLLQECAGKLALPYWIQGGIGIHNAAAARLSGATGVVLCEQLWLAAEGPFDSPAARQPWSHLDGSETVLAGAGASLHRLFARSGRARLRQLALAQAGGEPCMPLLSEGLALHDDGLVALGQEIAFAAPLAQRYGTVGRIVTAVKAGMADGARLAAGQAALAPQGALASALGTRYPVAQGPMTRVSDVAPFARAVAEGGGLPFLALAVMRGPQVRAMLEATRDSLGELPWGVGLLGFMPLALRQEQLDVVREFRPPYAVIAGGRPGQARELEALGIATWLHVPSPGLLRGFVAEGARHFVFEGSECGGHTGPRSSFTLWEQAVSVLLEADIKDASSLQIMFAGGIHDALSAAMVAALAAPLVARGAQIGVWMGSAYLFTEEIVGSGAVVEEFQRQALACRDTALLQSGVGVYTRCADTPFCAEFEQVRSELVRGAASEEETVLALERLNIGRLRIAAKGITRAAGARPASDAGLRTAGDADANADVSADLSADADGAADVADVIEGAARYVGVDAEVQRREGIYMLGDVARLRDRTCRIAELHADVSSGAQALLAERMPTQPSAAPWTRPRKAARDDIAIVGMACLWPGAQNLRQYWENIVRGVDSVREVSPERWDPALMFNPQRGAADRVYAKWGGFLDDIAFDPQLYGIAPASLASIEPMQLLALEVARQALADAGFDRRPFPRERTATIFAVGGMADLSSYYNFRTLLPLYLDRVEGLAPELRRQIVETLNRDALPDWSEDAFPGILGNVVAGRIANRLDLGGSNYTVDAACAASLAALDAAIRQLRSGDADVALAGGIDCTNGAIGFMCFAQTHALSPRGRSRPFDQGADGIAISEGVGALVLKRLGDAERDGDRIYALIKGIGSSSDGRNRSLTAPHPAAQVQALRRAYEDAGVDPASVSLIEAHGTGTALGDKSEIAALGAAFDDAAMPRQACALGSVKSMIGHTKVAAGMAGLIKAALALQQRVLPPTIGVEQPTKAIDLGASPFYLNTEARPWLHAQDAPRHCGVSAFGFGGTNFHAVLAEYTGSYRTAGAPSLHPRDAEIFAFAAADREQIVRDVQALLQGLDSVASANDGDLPQLAYALYREQHVTRRANGGEPCRLTVLAGTLEELRGRLQRVLQLLPAHAEIRQPPAIYYRESTADVGRVCFLFPGQGSQRVNMLRDLVLATPSLQANFDAAGEGGSVADVAVASLVYPPPVFSDAEREAQQTALNATDVAQPALGMAGMAAFELLTSYGLAPDYTAGHSYGEYVALCAAGVISRADLRRLSAVRGRLAAAAPAGAMAVLDGDAAQVGAALERYELKATIANLNAPSQTIIAGGAEAIDAALAALAGAGIRVRRLPVSAAFHCSLMQGVQRELAEELAKVDFHAPRVPVYSNTTAAPHAASGDEVRTLLARHIAEPVRFVEQVEALYRDGARVFIECGPGLVLNGLVGQILGQRPHTTLALDAPGRPGWLQLAQLLTQAMSIGLPVDLAAWFAGRGLEDSTLAQVLAAAARRAAPAPLAWRVNGGRALPWHAVPRRAAAAPVQPAPAQHVPAAPVLPEAHTATAAPAAQAAQAAPEARPVLAAQAVAVTPHIVPTRAVAHAPPSAPVPPPLSRPVLPSSHLSPVYHRRSIMKLDDFAPDDRPAAIPGQTTPISHISHVSQIQDGLARLLDLQREQQFSLRHFLDFQARMAGLEAHHAPAPSMPAHYAAQAVVQTEPQLAALAPHPQPARAASAGAAAANVAPSAPAPAMPAIPATPAAAPGAPIVLAATPRAPQLPAELTQGVPPAAAQAVHAAPAAQAAPAANAAVPSGPSAAQFQAELLQAVSERTGYPTDMLDMDAHMEADLGIDSIKRIEIFSGLTTRYNLIGDRDEETVIAELSGYKSLNEIVGWYARSLEPAGAAATATAPATAAASGDPLPKKAKAPLSPLPETVEPSVPTDTAPAAVPAGDAAQADADPVRCYVLQARAADLERGAGQHVLDLPRASHVLLVGADTPLSTTLCELLAQQGYPVHQLLPGAATRKLDAQRYEVDFSSLAGVAAWHALAAAETGPAGRASVLINLMPCDEATPAAHLGDARALFLLLKVLAPELRTGAAAWLLNVTGLDGQFGLGLGLGRSGALAVGGAGTLGVAKSAAREWPALRVKCVDAAPGLAPQWLALQLLRELCGLDGSVDAGADAGIEVGYTRTGRWRLELRPDSAAPAGTATAMAGLTLDAGAVVLVTGGAYGITADIAGMLARLYRPRLVLVGRSALPAPEAQATRDIADEGALRQALIVQLRATRPQLTPAMVNGEFKRIVKERRIRANLEAMRAAGADVEYHCLDVRDSAALGRLIDGVYARHGRIDGVLHGAGVIGDKLIADKAPEGYDAVFDTKVLPALLMAERLRPAGLKFVAFFSSVAGRFGNAGQCDYAAANEVLNKLAQDLSVRWPAVHTLAINWGPWDAGMVDDGLRRLYAARSIRPIPVDEGLRHFMQALGAGARGTPELVVSASVRQIAALKLGAPATATANNTASVAAVAAPAPPQQAGPAAPPTPFMPALPIHPTMSAISGEPS